MSHKVISPITEKTFDKIEHPLLSKVLNNFVIEITYLYIKLYITNLQSTLC